MTEPEQRLRDQLERTIKEALDEMLHYERVEPGLLVLIAGAAAAIRALDHRTAAAAHQRSDCFRAG